MQVTQDVQNAVQKIYGGISKEACAKYGITNQTIFTDILEHHIKNTASQSFLETDVRLNHNQLISFLNKVSDVYVNQDFIKDMIAKYTIFDFIYKNESNLITKVKVGASKEYQFTYIPFSPSAGLNADVIKQCLDSNYSCKRIDDLAKANQSGMPRCIENFFYAFLDHYSKDDSYEKTLLVLHGANGVSLRANFDMVEYNEQSCKIDNKLNEIGFTKAGGHQRAAGCSTDDKKFIEIKNVALQSIAASTNLNYSHAKNMACGTQK